jgi:hypothetical protein
MECKKCKSERIIEQKINKGTTVKDVELILFKEMEEKVKMKKRRSWLSKSI